MSNAEIRPTSSNMWLTFETNTVLEPEQAARLTAYLVPGDPQPFQPERLCIPAEEVGRFRLEEIRVQLSGGLWLSKAEMEIVLDDSAGDATDLLWMPPLLPEQKVVVIVTNISSSPSKFTGKMFASQKLYLKSFKT